MGCSDLPGACYGEATFGWCAAATTELFDDHVIRQCLGRGVLTGASFFRGLRWRFSVRRRGSSTLHSVAAGALVEDTKLGSWLASNGLNGALDGRSGVRGRAPGITWSLGPGVSRETTACTALARSLLRVSSRPSLRRDSCAKHLGTIRASCLVSRRLSE